MEKKTDHVAFDHLCKKTGVKKAVLAERCGKTPTQFSRYCNGQTPVPQLVWKEIERIAERNA